MMYFDVLTVQYSVQLIAGVLTVEYKIHQIANVFTVEHKPVNCTFNHKYMFCGAPAICYNFYKPFLGRSCTKE